MNIYSYISKIEFDKYEIYFRENKNFETVLLDYSENSKLLNVSNYTELTNGIIDKYQINSTFDLIIENDDKQFINSLIQDERLNFFPNRKMAIFDTAIIFYKNGSVSEYLNISLKEKISRSKEDYPIDMSLEFVEKLANKIQSLSINVFKNYLPPSLAILEQWRHYIFPFEFYSNPVFEVYEARINSGLFAINWKHAKIEIVPKNGRIEISQLNKAKYIEENRVATRKILLDKFWEEYTKWKLEYELPELNHKEQLYRFIELASIRIENDENLSTQIYFRTWDEEHGQYVRYIDKDEIEFE
jgi:hypothetical protein